MVNFSLDGKIALITGASRGIGKAIAETLAENGAFCVLVSRKIEDLEKVVEQIRSKEGTAECYACNMGQLDQIDKLMEFIKDRFGKLDILVNNAATNPHFGEITTAEEWAWDKIHEVNLKGPFFLTKAAAALMKENGGGNIVNVSSINGVKPAFLQGVYSISKAGLIAMTQAFAKELAHLGIRVNALLPGLTETKFASALTQNEDIKKIAVSQIPMGRIAEPEEMAGAVLFLVSEASSYTTGTCLTCDGGMLA